MTASKIVRRIGKSQFLPLIPELKIRRALGETYQQIHDDLIAKNKIGFCLQQFSNYMRKYVVSGQAESATIATAITQPVAAATTTTDALAEDKRPNGFSHLAELNPRKPTDYNSVPDLERIYGRGNNGDS